MILDPKNDMQGPINDQAEVDIGNMFPSREEVTEANLS